MSDAMAAIAVDPAVETPQPVEAAPPEPVLLRIEHALAELRDASASVRSRLGELETGMESLSKQMSLLPPQVRSLGGRIDGLSTSISEPRLRSVLGGVLDIYDLVEQASAGPAGEGREREEQHCRNYQVLRTQLRQLLERNGLSEIPADGAFDPQLHRALERVAVADPARAGRIVRVVRAGFRTEGAVLRYAEVAVGYRDPITEEANK